MNLENMDQSSIWPTTMSDWQRRWNLASGKLYRPEWAGLQTQSCISEWTFGTPWQIHSQQRDWAWVVSETSIWNYGMFQKHSAISWYSYSYVFIGKELGSQGPIVNQKANHNPEAEKRMTAVMGSINRRGQASPVNATNAGTVRKTGALAHST